MKFLTALLLFMSLGTLYAQGEYIEKGQNGYGITLGGGYNQKVLSIGGTAAVSNSGIVDFGIGYGYLFGEKDTSEFKSNSTIITPFAGVHILKQSDTNPVSLSASILFNIHRFTTKDESEQLSVGSWSIGAAVFHRFEVSQKLQIQPFAAFSFFRPERFPGYEAPSMIPVFDAALALITKKGENSKIILKPSVSISTNETTYSLNFEFVGLL